ncbi:AsnC family protein [Rhodovastum atsumiense]|uniref:AsnC family protein n=1 Tax=Rhodovastum atsumiense TaxID=504468 RepID=A0A5M6IWN6_9PROT|nr:AsnC family protein [Rhodovastum atsumiense]CAH2600280.1 AsnC family protein [Rhodovastum atsumiense]
MPTARPLWTPPRDAQLRRLRAEGATWAEIAAALSVTRIAAIDRGRRIGARAPFKAAAPAHDDPARDPLPAGHPRAWAVLTAGTCLAGTLYPLSLVRGA